MRDMLFISHANPEDNEFARWLALRLAAEGYPVWCDLTKLLGGEDFWKDIEAAIRDRCSKFLYVLSRVSNSKDGPRNELRVACVVQGKHQLRDFILPLRIDDIPHSEVNIELSRKHAIDFSHSWAHGLEQLLRKLTEEQTPRDPRFSPDAVTGWWRGYADPDRGIIAESEEYLSNWFPFEAEPDAIKVHVLQHTCFPGYPGTLTKTGYAAVGQKRHIVTFANADDLKDSFGQQLSVETTHTFSIAEFLGPEGCKWIGPAKQRRDILYRILSEAWGRFLVTKGLIPHDFSNGKRGYFFTLDLITEKPIAFKGVEERVSRRALIGHNTIRRVRSMEPSIRHWHFGITADPMFHPFLAFGLKYRVAFSDDGKTLWSDKRMSHRARRRVTRNWWNGEWRDRSLAVISWIAGGADYIIIPVGSTTNMRVSRMPAIFRSPVRYLDPQKIEYPEDQAEEDEEGDNETPEDQEPAAHDPTAQDSPGLILSSRKGGRGP